MSRSSAKERSRVQDSGRHISTFRVVENFGSWKHEQYPAYDSPALIPLSRRFIGGKNSGRKLALTTKTVEIRKRTERMVMKFSEAFWSGSEFKLVTIKTGSNYLNRKRDRREAKELVMAELTVQTEELQHLEDQRQIDAECDGLMETEETDRFFGERQRSEELADLTRNLGKASGLRDGKWGYHHFF